MSHIDGNTPLPPEQDMRALGFTDHREGYWYWSGGLPLRDTTFNVTINKATGEYEELVMDEFFGQPYHYGRYTAGKPIRAAVDAHLSRLNESGLTITVDHAAYGCTA